MRQPRDLEELLSLSEEHDITLHGQANRRDLSDPDDRFFLRIEVAHACRSSDDTSRRLRDAVEDRARDGRPHTSARRPYGYARGRELTAAAAEAEDVLVVCYLGHGLLDARGELYLATQATDHLRDGLGYTALPYATLHAELANSRARSVIVLLDCCFSGRSAG